MIHGWCPKFEITLLNIASVTAAKQRKPSITSGMSYIYKHRKSFKLTETYPTKQYVCYETSNSKAIEE
jgi:hypothetical protein